LIADFADCRIRRVSPDGIITTVAGNGTYGSFGDSGQATSAQVAPLSIAVDGAGDVLVGDTGISRIRKVTPDGTIATIAGNDVRGFSGDGGPATSAQLGIPYGVAADSAGNVYIADAENGRIRKVSSDGIITTVAGNGTCCTAGDNGPAISAQLAPYHVGVDSAGNLFVVDFRDHRIRKVTPDGIIATIAGNGAQGFSGDGGPATDAQLSNPADVAIDGAGNVFIADFGNNRIRKVSPAVSQSPRARSTC
jgi:glucose/arabinose dehydrogenase